jgi:hypothetical protein
MLPVLGTYILGCREVLRTYSSGSFKVFLVGFINALRMESKGHFEIFFKVLKTFTACFKNTFNNTASLFWVNFFSAPSTDRTHGN